MNDRIELRQLKVRASGRDGVVSTAADVEDALLTASLRPDVQRGLLVVRRLDGGRIRRRTARPLLARSLQTGLDAALARAADPRSRTAHRANAVFFTDPHEPYLLFARLLCGSGRADGWWWSLLFKTAPPYRFPGHLVESLRQAHHHPSGGRIAAQVVRITRRHGRLPELMTAVTERDASAFLERGFGLRAAAVGTTAGDRRIDQLTGLMDEHATPVRTREQGRSGPADAADLHDAVERVIGDSGRLRLWWLAACDLSEVFGPTPPVALVARRVGELLRAVRTAPAPAPQVRSTIRSEADTPLRNPTTTTAARFPAAWSGLEAAESGRAAPSPVGEQAGGSGETARSGFRPAAGALPEGSGGDGEETFTVDEAAPGPETPSRPAPSPLGPEDPRPESAPHLPSPGGSEAAATGAPAGPEEGHARQSASVTSDESGWDQATSLADPSRLSEAAGTALLTVVLERLGLPGLLAEVPDLAEACFGQRLIEAIARRLQVRDSDPALAFVALPNWAGCPPREFAFTLPTKAWALWAGEPLRLRFLGAPGWRCLTCRRGVSVLAAWEGPAPAGLRARLAGVEVARGLASNGKDVGLGERLLVTLQIAVRRYLRRAAGITLRQLALRAGRVVTTATHLDVIFPVRLLDLRLRRAALDVNPGWVPWLGRVVTFHYDFDAAGIASTDGRRGHG